MTEEKYNKSFKIISRLCKEANIFPGPFYKNIRNYVEENDSYVFYGRDGISYSKEGVNFEEKLFKLQLDLLRYLIDNDILKESDYCLAFSDTLTRYNVKKNYDRDRWLRIAKTARKKEFFQYFIEKFKEKVGEPNEKTLNIIIDGLPED